MDLVKIELLVSPAKQSICHHVDINIDTLSLAPTKAFQNLGVMIDDQLTFSKHGA